MNKSESISQLAAALFKAQSEFEGVEKSTENTFLKSKYADLAACLDASRKPLASNGLSVVQLPSFSEGMVKVESVLLHDSGEWISSELAMKPVKDDPQGIGSTITYARRYLLASMLGLAQKDDDAEARLNKGEKIKVTQAATIRKALGDIEMTEEDFQKKVRVKSIEEMGIDRYPNCVEWLIEQGAEIE